MFKFLLTIVIGMCSFTTNTFAADQRIAFKTELAALSQLESLNPELQYQVAGNCTKFWDVNLGKYEGYTCTSAMQEGVTWGLIGLLLGSLGPGNSWAVGAGLGFLFGIANHSN